jgi:hypothetical protein
MSEIRNLLARAQESETKGDKVEAADFLRKAATWYRDRQQLRRAAQMLRQARRVEGIEEEGDDPPAPVTEDVFGFGDDFAAEAGKVLVEQRTAQLADPSLDAWCSFCCRPQSEIGELVAGPAGAYICAGCTELSFSLRSGGAERRSAPRTVELTSLTHELPSQRRARERFLRHRSRLSLVIGPTGTGKSTFLASVAHADHRTHDVSTTLNVRELLEWLEAPTRAVSLVVTAPIPAPSLVLEGEHGPEPLHDTATLIASLPHLPKELASRIDAVHPFEEPLEADLTALARHLALARQLVLPDAVVSQLVALALRARTGAHELVTLLGRIPPGTYRA